jgi:hypothetical protein
MPMARRSPNHRRCRRLSFFEGLEIRRQLDGYLPAVIDDIAEVSEASSIVALVDQYQDTLLTPEQRLALAPRDSAGEITELIGADPAKEEIEGTRHLEVRLASQLAAVLSG